MFDIFNVYFSQHIMKYIEGEVSIWFPAVWVNVQKLVGLCNNIFALINAMIDYKGQVDMYHDRERQDKQVKTCKHRVTTPVFRPPTPFSIYL
jgi:hypothetical protein